MNELKQAIGEHPFLKGMRTEYLDVLARHAREVNLKEGQVLFRENESAYAFFLIFEGKVALESYVARSENIAVQLLCGGDVLGWSWLFPPFTWHFQARAVAPTRAIFIDGASLLVACENDPNLGYEMIQRIAEVVIHRLQVTRRQLVELPAASTLEAELNRLRAQRSGSSLSGTLRERLATHPFLAGLRAEHLDLLAESAMGKDFAANELIFAEGAVANRFYLIEEGTVALETSTADGNRVAIEVIGPGDVLGWSWLFPPFYWHFDARAREQTKCIFIYGTKLREQCEADHKFGYEIVKRMCQVVIARLQATRKQLLAAKQSCSA